MKPRLPPRSEIAIDRASGVPAARLARSQHAPALARPHHGTPRLIPAFARDEPKVGRAGPMSSAMRVMTLAAATHVGRRGDRRAHFNTTIAALIADY